MEFVVAVRGRAAERGGRVAQT